MGLFSAATEGGLGGLKGAGKWWLVGLGLCIAGGAVIGAIACFAAPAFIPLGLLVGAIVGTAAAFTPIGLGIGGLVATIGGLFGIGKGVKENASRGQKDLDNQTKGLRNDRAQLEQELAMLKQNGGANSKLEAANLAEQARLTEALRQQNGEYMNPGATTGHLESLKQRDAQRQNFPPLGVG